MLVGANLKSGLGTGGSKRIRSRIFTTESDLEDLPQFPIELNALKYSNREFYMSSQYEGVWIAPGAIVVDEVKIGQGSSIWYNAVVRGDIAPVVIGKNSNIQECCVVHVDHNKPTYIGNGCSIGHGAIIHGCTIGDNSLIGMGAIVLNDVTIGRDCIIGAGALVTQGTVIPDGHMAFGSPAKIIRELKPEEIRANMNNVQEYVDLAAQLLNAS